MVRTKIEKYQYAVIDRKTRMEIGFVESDVELKTKKAKKDAIISAGLPEDAVCVLIDTVSARYEMPDNQFYAEAKRLDD
jgi:hypothetical protein